jgi:putative Mn2+ efflux pump MntP
MERHLVIVLLLARYCNLGNIAIGISYGVRNIRLPWLSNVLIAFLTGFGTWIFIISGQRIITRNIAKNCDGLERQQDFC